MSGLVSAGGSRAISVRKTVVLVDAVKTRIVDPEVSFLTVPHLPNSDL